MLTDKDLESEAERFLWERIEFGERVDCRVGDPERDDPDEGGSWGTERSVRAQLLAELVTTERRPSGQPPRALRLLGARITGKLDLQAVTLVCPLMLNDCHLEAPLTVDETRAPSIGLVGCSVPSISARQLETRGDLKLDRLTAQSLNLEGARLGGVLSLRDVKVSGKGERVLNGDRLEVNQEMRCQGFTAEGEVRLLGAHIGGQLNFNGATLHQALNADRLQVDQNLFFREGFSAEGDVRLLGAHVSGQLSFDGATLHQALIADRLQVDQDMFCREGFNAEGDVRLPGAHIGGELNFDGATLHQALIAYGLQVDRDMFFREGFSAEGEVRLLGAHVSGQLSFDGATLHQALIAERLQVDQDMFCREGFSAEGGVCLPGAHVSGQLSFDGATLSSKQLALDLEGAHVDSDLRLLFNQRPAGGVDLSGARLGGLIDSEQTWPVVLQLRGCVYASVQAAEDVQSRRGMPPARRWARRHAALWRLRPGGVPDVGRRLGWIYLAEDGELPEKSRYRRVTQRIVCLWQEVAWTARRLLGRHPHQRSIPATAGAGYAPQPYTQLIAVYRQEGRDGDARRVAYERERRQRGQLGLPGKAWNLFLQGTVGYGYKPLRTLALLGALLLVGTLVFSSFHTDGQLVPVKSGHPPFVASIYTLDRLIPVVSFGLRDAFAPSGAAQWWAFAYTLLGWVLTIAVVAGLNAAVRRD